jgi:hypothetical protein
MTAFLRTVFADPTTNFLIALLIVLPLLDWVTGTLRAIANHTFSFELWDVFVRTQIAGRALPLILLIIAGRAISVAAPGELAIPGFDLSILTAAGALAAVPFLTGLVGSVLANVNPKVPDGLPSVTEGGS